MDRRFSKATSSLPSAALKLCNDLASYWRTVLTDQGYRPELHYMRGRGPKWREAHVCLREARAGSPILPRAPITARSGRRSRHTR
jgi:hypothetical protein